MQSQHAYFLQLIADHKKYKNHYNMKNIVYMCIELVAKVDADYFCDRSTKIMIMACETSIRRYMESCQITLIW